jgi:hypothetical protein
MKQATIRTVIWENRWVVTASIFFLLWKLLLVGIMWDERSIPPEPDDSYEYIGNIASVSECKTTLACPYPGVSMSDNSGFNYLSYRVFFGLIGRLSGLTPDTVYHISFYLGTLILPLVLIVLILTFTSDRKLIAWALLFLAFYHGTGETHGFFWVVPSFFTTVLFFTLFAYIVRGAYTTYWGAVLIAIGYALSHPISIYLTALFPISILYSSFLSKSWDIAIYKRLLIVVSTVIFSAVLQSMYLNYFSQINYYGFNVAFSQANASIRDLVIGSNSTDSNLFGYKLTNVAYSNLLQQRIDAMYISYFRYVLPHWIALFPLLLTLVILYVKKHYQLLSLYLSALCFFITTTLLNEYGFRSAIILWPQTFLIYAFGTWYLFDYVKNINHPGIRRLTSTGLGITILLFFLMNASLAITFNLNLNLRHKYSIDPAFATYLEARLAPGETVGLNNMLIRTTGGTHLFLSQKVGPQNTESQYLAFIDDSGLHTDVQPRSTIGVLSGRILNTLDIHIAHAPQQSPIRPPANYSLEKEFGVLKIYRYNP